MDFTYGKSIFTTDIPGNVWWLIRLDHHPSLIWTVRWLTIFFTNNFLPSDLMLTSALKDWNGPFAMHVSIKPARIINKLDHNQSRLFKPIKIWWSLSKKKKEKRRAWSHESWDTLSHPPPLLQEQKHCKLVVSFPYELEYIFMDI